MPPVFAIRPEPGLSATIQAGRVMGLEMVGQPLFEICPRAWEAPSPEDIDALLIGSANAIRSAAEKLAPFRDKPVHVVGEATAKAAKEAGLSVATVGSGGLQKVVAAMGDRPMRVLRLAGEDHVRLDPPRDVQLVTRICYASVASPMPESFSRRLSGGGIVLLHSARAARHFAQECARFSVARERLILAALGKRIADAAGSGWADIRWAETTSDSALLALAKQLCH